MTANLLSLKKKLLLLSLLVAGSAFAQIPPGYYDAANGQTGETLKATLNNIIDGHTEYSYGQLWDILKVTDRDPNNSNNVIGIYSRFSMDAAAEYAGGAGWNREHVWAKSRGDFGTTNGAGTDLHHIRASDVSTNSARGNKAFDNGGTVYVDGAGNYSGSTPAKTDSDSWEPGDDQKGDVARMIFYMAVRYEGENGEPDLELTDEVLSGTDKSPFHGRISVLLDWHAADPVSTEEINRHEAIYSYQNNRNPFIDHPEYVDMIWGSGSGGSTCTETEVTFTLITDNYPAETSWTLVNGTTTIASGSGYSGAGTTYTETLCLSDGTYDFTISDSYGDGICCAYGNGSYSFTEGGSTLISGGTFGSSETKSFTIGTSGGGGGGSTLFISEYIEGSSNNKALEIGNLTGGPVDLSLYDLRKQINGAGSWGSPLNLSGTLADGDAYAIAYSSASSTLTSSADLITSHSTMTFNGNDPIGLFHNGTLIDIVGNFNGGSTNFAQNTTLVRNSNAANTSYTTSEWDVYSQDTFNYFGSLNSGAGSGGSTEMPSGYCSSAGNNSSYEWLDYVQVGSLVNSSGDNGGYQDFTTQSVNINAGSTVSFELRPGFSGSVYNEAYRIWIDFNRDGQFESTEIVVDQGLTTASSIAGSFTVPGNVSNGTTRMRVTMQYNGSPASCGSFSYGEVEDYAVNLSGGSGARGTDEYMAFIREGIDITGLEIYPVPAEHELNIITPVETEGIYPIKIYDLTGKSIYESKEMSFRLLLTKQIDVANWVPGIYMLHAAGKTIKFNVK